MARTAVVAGTASAVAGGVSRRQQSRARDQQQAEDYREQQIAAQQMPVPSATPGYAPAAAAPAPQPAGDGTEDLIAQLRELGELRSSGVLTEEEFAAQKARLLNG